MRQYLNGYAAFRYPLGLTWDEMREHQWADLYGLHRRGWFHLLPEYYEIEKKFIETYMMFYDFFSVDICAGRKFPLQILTQLTDYSKYPFNHQKIDYPTLFYYDILDCFERLQYLFKRSCSTYTREEYEFLIKCHLRGLAHIQMYSEDGINYINNTDAGSLSLVVELHHTIKLTDIFEYRDGVFFTYGFIQRYLFSEDAEDSPKWDLSSTADKYGNIDLRTFDR